MCERDREQEEAILHRKELVAVHTCGAKPPVSHLLLAHAQLDAPGMCAVRKPVCCSVLLPDCAVLISHGSKKEGCMRLDTDLRPCPLCFDGE